MLSRFRCYGQEGSCEGSKGKWEGRGRRGGREEEEEEEEIVWGRPPSAVHAEQRSARFFLRWQEAVRPASPVLLHEKGCPMFRVLCETWDSTVPSLWGSCLHARKNRARVVGI